MQYHEYRKSKQNVSSFFHLLVSLNIYEKIISYICEQRKRFDVYQIPKQSKKTYPCISLTELVLLSFKFFFIDSSCIVRHFKGNRSVIFACHLKNGWFLRENLWLCINLLHQISRHKIIGEKTIPKTNRAMIGAINERSIGLTPLTVWKFCDQVFPNMRRCL